MCWRPWVTMWPGSVGPGGALSCAVLVVADAAVVSGVGACAAEELGVGIRVSSKWSQTGGLQLLLWLPGCLHACWSLLCPWRMWKCLIKKRRALRQ